jgi:hypothetical protein
MRHDERSHFGSRRDEAFETHHPVSLNDKNLLVKQSFNKSLEFFELLEDFRFFLSK